jgi:hypothetical protein
MQRFTIRKKVEVPKKNKLWEGLLGSVLVGFFLELLVLFRGAGGGEVSGGGTHYM